MSDVREFAPMEDSEVGQSNRRENVQPLPWWVDQGVHFWRVRDVNGFVVFSDITREEADFIVRACNSHDDLLAALKAILNLQFDHVSPFLSIPNGREILAQADAAIAKAEAR